MRRRRQLGSSGALSFIWGRCGLGSGVGSWDELGGDEWESGKGRGGHLTAELGASSSALLVEVYLYR